MPLYEYKCQECQETFENLQKFSDPPPQECPFCFQKHTLEKQIGKTSFQLKGGGWYKDLYSSVPTKK